MKKCQKCGAICDDAVNSCLQCSSPDFAPIKDALDDVKSEMVTPIAAAYFEDAERGDAAAQFHLGECYMEGIGVDVNSRIAVDWFKKSADQGFDMARISLGLCYYFGLGVKQSYTRAIELFRSAAEQSCAEALDWVGTCYLHGNGVGKAK